MAMGHLSRARPAAGLPLTPPADRLAGMDRASILSQSEKLERHIALVEEDLTKQRELVAELLRQREDASGAMALLRQFEELHARLLVDRETLRRHLDGVSG